MPAPAEIVQLVELFQRNYDQYCAPSFSEAAVRHQFIDPFFAALGWDVNNTQGFAEQYKEVVHEDKVLVGDATKAPDYSFRIGKERKFFVEAKKPSVNIKHDIEPAYQLRRYAWSAKLPLSILTDFEEFSVYDCRMRPDKSDKAATGRILLLNFTDYVARWDEIAGIFSKAAVWQGALDRFAVAKAGKRGTAEVDDEFLAEIERWRELLARNLVLRNPHLRGHDVNWAVQQTIDRIVFLRICEARNLETYEQLRALLNGGHTYARLWELFRRADLRYNSGLFHFSEERGRAEAPDTLTPGLEIDDRVLKDIIEHLYYPQSPYEFSVLPADILGHVYERFLGKVIRLTPGRQVKIEEKPEVRKAGGVYYTPTYIVDYIVRQTVGPLLEGKTPAHGRSPGSPPRVADIACGSGSFLLGAYQYLLDWHLAYYLEEPERWLKGKRPALERVSGGATRLTIEERKRILMDHLYGVDIDPQAVEVTKLSLLLKVLEGEGVAGQLSLGVERVLPDLGRNIKCGNSLIGPEFYDGKLDLPDDETARRVNAFDWHKEFPQVMAAGGFDAIIGNPPYIRIQALQEWAPLEVEHYKRAYRAASKGNYDIYVVFVEKGLRLLNEKGLLGFILPNKFLTTDYGRPLRELIVEKKALSAVVDFGHHQVFEQATTYTCLLFLAGSRATTFRYVSAEPRPENLSQVLEYRTIATDTLNGDSWVITDDASPAVYERLASKGVPLLDLPAEMSRGSSTGDDSIFVLHRTDQQ
ncbi:MAG: N-6 DNA methylase, partial [Anaerolineae bacterium]